MSVSETELRN